MKEVTRHHCGICNKEFEKPEEAQKCESVGCEELRVEAGDFCYIIEEVDGFFGWRTKCKKARVVAIPGPTNPHGCVAKDNKTIPAPHMYEILVTTKKFDKLRSLDKHKLPRYPQSRIYVPADRR